MEICYTLNENILHIPNLLTLSSLILLKQTVMKILKFSIVLLCSIFSMAATAQSLVALKNLSPADGKAFTDRENKALIPFSWTLIAPKPREAVMYRLRIWQLTEGQNADDD